MYYANSSWRKSIQYNLFLYEIWNFAEFLGIYTYIANYEEMYVNLNTKSILAISEWERRCVQKGVAEILKYSQISHY